MSYDLTYVSGMADFDMTCANIKATRCEASPRRQSTRMRQP